MRFNGWFSLVSSSALIIFLVLWHYCMVNSSGICCPACKTNHKGLPLRTPWISSWKLVSKELWWMFSVSVAILCSLLVPVPIMQKSADNFWNWNRWFWRLGTADSNGLNMLHVKMMLTGLSVLQWCTFEMRRDVRIRQCWKVLRMIWTVLFCPKEQIVSRS